MEAHTIEHIAQQIWEQAGKDLQKLAAYAYPEHNVCGIDIAVGWAIGKERQFNRRCDRVREIVHKMGYFLANDEYDHPPNMVGQTRFNIFMGGDFGMRDDDPYLVKFYNKPTGEIF